MECGPVMVGIFSSCFLTGFAFAFAWIALSMSRNDLSMELSVNIFQGLSCKLSVTSTAVFFSIPGKRWQLVPGVV